MSILDAERTTIGSEVQQELAVRQRKADAALAAGDAATLHVVFTETVKLVNDLNMLLSGMVSVYAGKNPAPQSSQTESIERVAMAAIAMANKVLDAANHKASSEEFNKQ